MEPIFTLPYSEYFVVNELSKHFRKKEDFSILIPSSRQQKGFDLVTYNSKNGKSITIQVKSSRTYYGKMNKRNNSKKDYQNYMWFNKFEIEEPGSNYYILFGVFPNKIKGKRQDKSKPNKWWDRLFLIFTKDEMISFLNKIRQKRENKPDTSFAFGFDNKGKIYLTRGSVEDVDYSKHLLNEQWIDKIRGELN